MKYKKPVTNLTLENHVCEMCQGQLGLLGKLGRLIWLLCRNCGMQFSIEVTQ